MVFKILNATSIAASIIKFLWNLAYPIKNNKKAFYELMNIELPNENIRKINEKLNLNENIIRYITVKVKNFEGGPSPMMKGND